MNFDLLHPRDQIVATMERIYGHDMTTTSGGNISVRDENGDVWITPARVDKGNLRREDVVCLKPDGSIMGTRQPSSEWPFHLAVYRARPDLQAVVHAHPGALVSFSISGQTPDTRVFPQAFNVCGKVGFAPYALPGSKQLGENIAAEFASANQPNCVLLENHGVVVGGKDLPAAFARLETLEFTAQIILKAHQLGNVHYLGQKQLGLASVQELPALKPEPASSREKELRMEICEFVRRAYDHRLMTSTWGSFSARVDDAAFVITPYNVDRRTLSVEDLVLVRDGKCEAGAQPSRAARLHAAIYQAHPEIQSVVNAMAVHATAFSVSEADLDARTIPESYLFLKEVQKIAFEHQYDNGGVLASTVTPRNPVALLAHNGAIIAGRSVLDAFDRLEVLEATAAAIIRGRVLGPIRPMSQTVIEELEQAFPNL